MLGPVFFRTASRAYVVITWRGVGCHHLERGGMSSLGEGWNVITDAVGINCKKVHQLKIKAQVSSIRAKGCMVDDCVCVCYLT